ncbi:MAG: formimidoylglutamase [Candidatus Melainabacteria bacterium]|nr:formimidoylglutamase [Candidatus Melainabacteria bacterium]
MKNPRIGILGVPFDLGIKLNKGRPGARFAPKKIKEKFYKLISEKKRNRTKYKILEIVDYGNIVPAYGNVKATHEKVTKAVKKIIKDGCIPIVIGGGHDISFGSGKAASVLYRRIGQINIDAHYDVRPVINGKINSGTPFRRLLEGKYLIGNQFVELGLHSPKNLKEHYQYLLDQRATLIKMDSIHKTGIDKAMKKAFLVAGKNTNAIVFDIDIDGVQKRFAPGCSAPSVHGFTKSQILRSAYLAGKNIDVRLFNLMEVSPVYDVRNKTVKLAAELIVNFIDGVSERN